MYIFTLLTNLYFLVRKKTTVKNCTLVFSSTRKLLASVCKSVFFFLTGYTACHVRPDTGCEKVWIIRPICGTVQRSLAGLFCIAITLKTTWLEFEFLFFI